MRNRNKNTERYKAFPEPRVNSPTRSNGTRNTRLTSQRSGSRRNLKHKQPNQNLQDGGRSRSRYDRPAQQYPDPPGSPVPRAPNPPIPPGPPPASRQLVSFESLTWSELRTQLRKRNLPTNGTREILLERLRDSLESGVFNSGTFNQTLVLSQTIEWTIDWNFCFRQTSDVFVRNSPTTLIDGKHWCLKIEVGEHDQQGPNQEKPVGIFVVCLDDDSVTGKVKIYIIRGEKKKCVVNLNPRSEQWNNGWGRKPWKSVEDLFKEEESVTFSATIKVFTDNIQNTFAESANNGSGNAAQQLTTQNSELRLQLDQMRGQAAQTDRKTFQALQTKNQELMRQNEEFRSTKSARESKAQRARDQSNKEKIAQLEARVQDLLLQNIEFEKQGKAANNLRSNNDKLKQQASQVPQLQSELKSAKEGLKALRKEQTELEKQHRSATGDVASLSKRVKESAKRISEQQKELKSSRKDGKQLLEARRLMTEGKKELSESKKRLSASEKELKELRRQLTSGQKQLEEDQRQFQQTAARQQEEAQKQFDRLKHQHDEAQRQVADSRSVEASLKSTHSNLTKQHKQLQSEHGKLAKQHSQATKAQADAERRLQHEKNKKKKGKVDEKMQRLRDEEHAKVKSEHDGLRRQYTQLEQDHQTLRLNAEQLEVERSRVHDERKELSGLNTQMQDDIGRLEKQLSSVEGEREKLQKNLLGTKDKTKERTLKAERDHLKKELEQAISARKDASAQLRGARKERDDYKAKIEDLTGKQNRMQIAMSKVKKERDDARKASLKAKSSRQALQKTVKDMKAKLKTIEGANTGSAEREQQMNRRLQATETKLKDVTREKAVTDKQLGQGREREGKLEADKAELERQNKGLALQLKEQTQSAEKAQTALEKLQKSKKGGKLKDLEKERDQLRERVQELEAQAQSAAKQLSENNASLRREVDLKSSELGESRKAHQDLQKQNEGLQGKTQELLTKVTKLQKRNKITEKQLREKGESQLLEIAKMKQDHEKALAEALHKSELTGQRHQKQAAAIQAKKQKHQQLAATYLQESKTLRTRTTNQEVEITKVRKQLQDVRKQATVMRQKSRKQMEELDTKDQEISRLRRINKDMNQRDKDKQQEIDRLNNTLQQRASSRARLARSDASSRRANSARRGATTVSTTGETAEGAKTADTASDGDGNKSPGKRTLRKATLVPLGKRKPSSPITITAPEHPVANARKTSPRKGVLQVLKKKGVKKRNEANLPEEKQPTGPTELFTNRKVSSVSTRTPREAPSNHSAPSARLDNTQTPPRGRPAPAPAPRPNRERFTPKTPTGPPPKVAALRKLGKPPGKRPGHKRDMTATSSSPTHVISNATSATLTTLSTTTTDQKGKSNRKRPPSETKQRLQALMEEERNLHSQKATSPEMTAQEILMLNNASQQTHTARSEQHANSETGKSLPSRASGSANSARSSLMRQTTLDLEEQCGPPLEEPLSDFGPELGVPPEALDDSLGGGMKYGEFMTALRAGISAREMRRKKKRAKEMQQNARGRAGRTGRQPNGNRVQKNRSKFAIRMEQQKAAAAAAQDNPRMRSRPYPKPKSKKGANKKE